MYSSVLITQDPSQEAGPNPTGALVAGGWRSFQQVVRLESLPAGEVQRLGVGRFRGEAQRAGRIGLVQATSLEQRGRLRNRRRVAMGGRLGKRTCHGTRAPDNQLAWVAHQRRHMS